MAFDFIIRGVNKTVGDGTLGADEILRRSNRKGGVSACVPAGAETPSRHLTGKQIPPAFIVVRCDLTEAEARAFCNPWMPEITFAWQSQSVPNDRWRINVQSGLIRARDNHGGMSQARAKRFLDAWGFSGQSYLANRARGAATILQMASSAGMWQQLADSDFAELSYDTGTGAHLIRLDHGTNRPGRGAQVRRAVAAKAAFVAQNAAANTVDFAVMRDQVQAAFERNVREKLERKLAMRRWRLTESEVDRIAAGRRL